MNTVTHSTVEAAYSDRQGSQHSGLTSAKPDKDIEIKVGQSPPEGQAHGTSHWH